MAGRTFKIARDYCTELSLVAKTRGSQLSKYARVESREQGKNAKNSDLRDSQSGLDDEIAGKDRDGRNFPRITGKRFLLFKCHLYFCDSSHHYSDSKNQFQMSN